MANIKTPTNTTALKPAEAKPVAKRQYTVADYLKSDTYKRQFADALPKTMDADRFIRSALTEFRQNPALAECSVQSVMSFFLQAAACGLEPSTTLGQCYAVPFGNAKTGTKECQFVIGYRGMLTIVQRSGEVASVETRVVHEKDEFVVEYGLNAKLIHKPYPDFDDAGPMKGVYCIARFKDETLKPAFEYMSKSEIDAHRKRSRASGSGPWVTDYEAMARKTVFRALFKWLPARIETIEIMNKDEEYKSDDKKNDLLEVEFVAAEDDGGTEDAVNEIAENMKGAEA